MQRRVLVLALLTSVLPIPAVAEAMGDAVMLGAAQDLNAKLAGIADGSVRMIHLSEAPEAAPGPAVSPARLKDRPPPRPPILVANSCGWADAPEASARLRAAVTGPLWLLEPQDAGCDAAQITAAAQKAAAAPERDRLALLIGAGLQLSAVEPAALPAVTASAAATAAGAGDAPAGAAMAGKLVISALPAGATLTGAPATVIRASDAPVPQAAASGTETRAEATPAAPRAVPVSMARRPGQPEPAIIVGELASLLGARNRGPMGTPREVRDRIRQIDSVFFAMMLDEGRFDPAEGQYAAAIQTELSQMNCYDGSVDGSWGNGSLAALRRYFSTLGQAQAGTAPSPELYRQIATNDSVRCPVEQRVSVPRNDAAPTRNNASTTPRNTGSRNNASTRNNTRGTAATASRSTQPRPQATQPATQARPATGSAPRINPDLANGTSSGGFR